MREHAGRVPWHAPGDAGRVPCRLGQPETGINRMYQGLRQETGTRAGQKRGKSSTKSGRKCLDGTCATTGLGLRMEPTANRSTPISANSGTTHGARRRTAEGIARSLRPADRVRLGGAVGLSCRPLRECGRCGKSSFLPPTGDAGRLPCSSAQETGQDIQRLRSKGCAALHPPLMRCATTSVGSKCRVGTPSPQPPLIGNKKVAAPVIFHTARLT